VIVERFRDYIEEHETLQRLKRQFDNGSASREERINE